MTIIFRDSEKRKERECEGALVNKLVWDAIHSDKWGLFVKINDCKEGKYCDVFISNPLNSRIKKFFGYSGIKKVISVQESVCSGLYVEVYDKTYEGVALKFSQTYESQAKKSVIISVRD